MSKTRIIILQVKELIYAGIFIALGILLVVLLVVMFFPGSGKGKDEASVNENQSKEIYQAGIYTKEVKIGDQSVDIQLALDSDGVKSVDLVNLDESVETMYPLMKPAVKQISKQLAAGKSVDEIVVSGDSKYTEQIIVDTLNEMMTEHEK